MQLRGWQVCRKKKYSIKAFKHTAMLFQRSAPCAGVLTSNEFQAKNRMSCLFFPALMSLICPLFLDRSWPCPVPCLSIWMCTTSANQHPGSCFCRCTGRALSLPSQHLGEILFYQGNLKTCPWLAHEAKILPACSGHGTLSESSPLWRHKVCHRGVSASNCVKGALTSRF